jgi:hypothetical protein
MIIEAARQEKGFMSVSTDTIFDSGNAGEFRSVVRRFAVP